VNPLNIEIEELCQFIGMAYQWT